MKSINLRESLNVISEVIINRPKPLREFDQIYMRAGDMMLQAEHISRLFSGKDVVFIGDGDSIGLCLAHLHNKGILDQGPTHIHVLDFDERIVLSIQQFAKQYAIENCITSELYNVADPLPEHCWQKFKGFYTNPPYGASNGGTSVQAFLKRGVEASQGDSVAGVVIADDSELDWTKHILYNTQKFMSDQDFFVSELIPEFHTYHLDDNPALRSCSISFKRNNFAPSAYSSKPLSQEMLKNFYGNNIPLKVKFVKDLTNGGKMSSRDHELVPINPNIE
jgi:predicted methyltransferase